MRPPPSAIYLVDGARRRAEIIHVTVGQTVFYTVFACMLAVGLTGIGEASLDQAGTIVLASACLFFSVLFFTAMAMFRLRAPLWIDPDSQTLCARSMGSMTDRYATYEDVEQLTPDWSPLHGVHLRGPLAERTGVLDPDGRLRIGVTRSAIGYPGAHPMTPLLPQPLTHLTSQVVAQDRFSWSDAFRFALYLNQRRLWKAIDRPANDNR